jgi:hypothetical protein
MPAHLQAERVSEVDVDELSPLTVLTKHVY